MNQTPNYVSPFILPGCRLGNVMFSIAAVYAHALRHSLQIKIPWEENNDCILLREFINGEAGIPPTQGAVNEHPSFAENVEKRCIPSTVTTGSLAGYFQDYRYFEEYRDEITSLYSSFISAKEPNTIGIHVRMGDYMVLRGKYWVTNRRYLRGVSRLISANVSKLVIFSDDPERALKLVKSVSRFAAMEIEVDNSTNPCMAIKRMTAMQELVLSSSSFSWWGAYLGTPNKVFCPRNWYIHFKDNQQSNLQHPDWIKVSNLSLFDKLCRIGFFARVIVKIHFLFNKKCN